MSEQDKPAEDQQNQQNQQNQQEQAGEGGESQQEKSTINKVIDKAQEKGLTDKAANVVKNKLKGRGR